MVQYSFIIIVKKLGRFPFIKAHHQYNGFVCAPVQVVKHPLLLSNNWIKHGIKFDRFWYNTTVCLSLRAPLPLLLYSCCLYFYRILKSLILLHSFTMHGWFARSSLTIAFMLTSSFYIPSAKRQPSGKDQSAQKKKEELEKRLEDVSDKLGIPKKPKKS